MLANKACSSNAKRALSGSRELQDLIGCQTFFSHPAKCEFSVRITHQEDKHYDV